MLVILESDSLHESDVGLVRSNSLNERLSENQVIRRSIVDGERRERGGEPRLVSDGGVEDAVSVGEVGHVVCVDESSDRRIARTSMETWRLENEDVQ